MHKSAVCLQDIFFGCSESSPSMVTRNQLKLWSGHLNFKHQTWIKAHLLMDRQTPNQAITSQLMNQFRENKVARRPWLSWLIKFWSLWLANMKPTWQWRQDSKYWVKPWHQVNFLCRSLAILHYFYPPPHSVWVHRCKYCWQCVPLGFCGRVQTVQVTD